MSCCPAALSSSALGGAFSETNGPESDIRRGESVECYMQRGGNTTGLHDDATANVNNKIDNASVPITRSTTTASVNTQFKLTAGSSRTPTIWSATSIPPGLTLTTGGHLSGAFSSLAIGNVYTLVVMASDNDGAIDERSFTLAPSLGAEDSEIRLINPLPSGIVNSKFGPRLHPIQHVMKPHTGIDIKLADHSVKSVVAAADGEVVLAGGNNTFGYGLRVWIKHNTAGGQHLCTTTYNHLDKIYVVTGQKVIAGQAIGLEGSTGSSTGNHLHFECRLPDGKFIDPEPLINGELTVADATLTNGDADPASLHNRISSASLAAAEVKARSDSCQPFGVDYPPAVPPENTDATPTPSTSSTDPFELAWHFTMLEEVGPFWETLPQYSPGDGELDAGFIDTKEQRKKTGYVNSPNFPGGETKFGIAQKPNPSFNVRSIDYLTSKNAGYNNYWQSIKVPCTDKGALVAIMLFDINFLHGDGNAKTIYQNSSISSGLGDSQAVQLAHCEALHNARLAFINRINRPDFVAGWRARASRCLAYVKSLPPL